MNRARRGTRSDHACGRRGFSVIYVGLIFILMCAFVAFAVDVGRIRLGKAQLQAAADGAARAGATGIPVSIPAGPGAAETIGDANPLLDGHVDLQPANDLEFGFWNNTNRTFTKYPDATHLIDDSNACRAITRVSAARNNSIQLIFAPVFGATRSNLQAEAIAMVTGFNNSFAFVGINSIGSNGNKATIQGSVASDGDINLGNGDVRAWLSQPGDAPPGIGHTIAGHNNSNVDGWTAPLDYTIATYFPPVNAVPGGAIAIPSNKQVSGGGTPATATAYSGDGSNITVTSGYVTIYQTANLSMGGVTFQNPSGNTVANSARVNFVLVGNHTISTGGGNNQMYAHVYAPQADFAMKGTQNFYGTLIAKSITFKGNSGLQYDGSALAIGNYAIKLMK